MKSRSFALAGLGAIVVVLVLVLVLAALTGCRPRPERPRPDLLVILIDCLRADHVGAYGHSRPTTPALDALAAEGVVFERAFAQSHWTRPSVPSILTGLYPSEHGLIDVERERERGKIVVPSLSDDIETLAESLQAVGYRTALIAEQHQLAEEFNVHQGFGFFTNQAGTAPNVRRKYLRWLDRQPTQDRTFAYLHLLDIHWPYCPPKRFRGRFDPGQSELALCRDWRQLRDDIRSGAIELTPADVELLSSRYDEELRAVDATLNGLFVELKRRDRWDDTMIVSTSDHGEEFLERGSIGHQGGLAGVLTHVPLIVKPPASWGGGHAARVSRLTELRSIAPTLREAGGALPGAGGPSLVPLLVGEQGTVVDYAVSESTLGVWVRSETHVLLFSKIDGTVELFEVASDPYESRDVKQGHPEVLAEMVSWLRQWRGGLKGVTPFRGEVDQETIEGLEDLGYLD